MKPKIDQKQYPTLSSRRKHQIAWMLHECGHPIPTLKYSDGYTITVKESYKGRKKNEEGILETVTKLRDKERYFRNLRELHQYAKKMYQQLHPVKSPKSE